MKEVEYSEINVATILIGFAFLFGLFSSLIYAMGIGYVIFVPILFTLIVYVGSFQKCHRFSYNDKCLKIEGVLYISESEIYFSELKHLETGTLSNFGPVLELHFIERKTKKIGMTGSNSEMLDQMVSFINAKIVANKQPTL